MRRAAIAIFLAAGLAAVPGHAQGAVFTSIDQYLPEGTATDGSADLTEHLQQALDEATQLYFPGSSDPENPRLYASRAGLVSQENARIVFGPNSLLRRLPSEGALIRLEPGASISGCVVDGNKYAHWPEFEDLGKGDYGIQTTQHNVVTDCLVYNNPGIAFGGWCHHCTFLRCRAENAGYIDVKFGADFYQGKWDQWSGDGFYVRGRGNLVRECVAYDCFRWDLCASHGKTQGCTFVDCRGGDINWRSYGFVDIEGSQADNRLIRCQSPNSRMSVSSPHTQVIDCIASGFSCYHADYLTIRGCIATSEGITVGRPLQEGKEYGGASPVVTGNRIYLAGPEGRHAAQALHVRSEDGAGIVAGNIIYAFEGDEGRSDPILVEGCEPGENEVVFGRWDVAEQLVRPRLIRGSVDWDHIARHKLATFEQQLARALPQLGIEGEPARRQIVIGDVPFAFATGTQGIEEQWFVADNRPKTRDVRVGWPWNKQVGDIYRPGWYFIDFIVPAEHAHKPAAVYFGAADSHATVWLNGEKLGEHDDWKEPFSFELADGFAAGANSLVVRVETPSGLAGLYKPVALIVK